MRVWKKSEVGGVVVERALWIVELKLCGWKFVGLMLLPLAGLLAGLPDWAVGPVACTPNLLCLTNSSLISTLLHKRNKSEK